MVPLGIQKCFSSSRILDQHVCHKLSEFVYICQCDPNIHYSLFNFIKWISDINDLQREQSR